MSMTGSPEKASNFVLVFYFVLCPPINRIMYRRAESAYIFRREYILVIKGLYGTNLQVQIYNSNSPAAPCLIKHY